MKIRALVRFLLITMFSSLTSLFALPLIAPAFADSPVTCTEYTLPVTLSPTDPTIYHIFGQLCSQGSPEGKTVQFVVHGITYDHNYWDWPLSPQKYSYVRKATDAGYVTFNIDRIGIGLSDHPLSSLVTLQSNAFVVHQLVQDLRTGQIGGTQFSKVVLVGHSFGAVIALYEQYTYADSNAIILSGFAHAPNPAGVGEAIADIYPASQDPKFANSNFPGTYLTTIPGTRGTLFYNLIDADPAVIALDENLKQTLTAEELATAPTADDPAVSLAIHVPVLIADGQYDLLFCNTSIGLSCDDSAAILAREQADFSPQACLETFVLPNSGHDVNLHLNAKSWFNAANDWVNRRVGSSVNNPPTQLCQ